MEVQLDGWLLVASAGEAREENFNVVDELVDESLVKGVREEGLLGPELHNLDMLNAGQLVSILDLSAVVLGERLGHFLPVLREPVPLAVLLLQVEFLLDGLVDLGFGGLVELADKGVEVFQFLHNPFSLTTTL